mmetsp:Transcript_10161/g.30124  ORF Transcript_10161/g.30124 Transcript_10161/m.30124 type:complete len:266 (+) Transcript_10161:151-948(+)
MPSGQPSKPRILELRPPEMQQRKGGARTPQATPSKTKSTKASKLILPVPSLSTLVKRPSTSRSDISTRPSCIKSLSLAMSNMPSLSGLSSANFFFNWPTVAASNLSFFGDTGCSTSCSGLACCPSLVKMRLMLPCRRGIILGAPSSPVVMRQVSTEPSSPVRLRTFWPSSTLSCTFASSSSVSSVRMKPPPGAGTSFISSASGILTAPSLPMMIRPSLPGSSQSFIHRPSTSSKLIAPHDRRRWEGRRWPERHKGASKGAAAAQA